MMKEGKSMIPHCIGRDIVLLNSFEELPSLGISEILEEGMFEWMWRPSRALNQTLCVVSGTTKIKDTGRGATLDAEIPDMV